MGILDEDKQHDGRIAALETNAKSITLTMRTLLAIFVQSAAYVKSKKIFAFVIVILLTFMFFQPTMGQDQETNNEQGWTFTIAPYLLLPFIDGEMTVNDHSTDIDIGPGEVLRNLNMVAMLYFEASNPKWALFTDVVYLKTGKDILFGPAQREGTAGLSITSIGFYGMRRATAWFELGIGGRVNFSTMKLNVVAGIIPPEIDETSDETWFDPLIVYRFTVPLKNENWNLGLLGDVGGFGVGSQFTYLINPYFGYEFAKWFELSFGFRWVGVNFERNTEGREQKLNLHFYGPEIGLLFKI